MAVMWDRQKDSWGPQPTVGPAAMCLELPAMPVSPHFSFWVFWDGNPALTGILEESPAFSEVVLCLMVHYVNHTGSDPQGWTCDFHVINKDSFR